MCVCKYILLWVKKCRQIGRNRKIVKMPDSRDGNHSVAFRIRRKRCADNNGRDPRSAGSDLAGGSSPSSSSSIVSGMPPSGSESSRNKQFVITKTTTTGRRSRHSRPLLVLLVAVAWCCCSAQLLGLAEAVARGGLQSEDSAPPNKVQRCREGCLDKVIRKGKLYRNWVR